ncbi:rhodanese-like domain-containing protein [Maribacter sp. MAR_2009_72]|uniref:rhodanese-like domain-containing protein n=1 Tax=Maribacter sp. MAR_2009_72 TaxID=1250050 RepID=UPI00119C4791|nr:rhodanese-like domain-containing protein [Maribacter sp. MAR_2009_72]TVZ15579.1 rhodanese-related sulfurtransferase [Maribacter sp. MAR_2009_72]
MDAKNSTFTAMKLIKYARLFSLVSLITVSNVIVGQANMERVLKNWNKESIPYIYLENLPMKDSIVYVDTREKEEFNVSHLRNALWVGYSNFDEAKVLNLIPNKSQPIIVYCSIGVRSENIGERLKRLGYTRILNLYGGIFEWKNQDRIVYNNNDTPTDSIHAFSKHWGKLLKKGIKVY